MNRFSLTFRSLLSTAASLVVLSACGGGGGNDGVATTLDSNPFAGSTALETPGRQVFSGNEKTLPGFDTGADTFVINMNAFGLGATLGFESASAAVLPTSGRNLIVLQDVDNDANPATPFGAGNAANLIAARITAAAPGLFIYHNSALGVNRLVYSANLNEPAADLAVLARIAAPTGQEAIKALGTFGSENFVARH